MQAKALRAPQGRESSQGQQGKCKQPLGVGVCVTWAKSLPAGISQTCLLSHCKRGGGSMATQQSILKINRSLYRVKRRMFFKRNTSHLSKRDRAVITNANATFRCYKPRPCSQLSLSACGQPAPSRQLRMGPVLNPVRL